MNKDESLKSKRTALKRKPIKAHYDKKTLYRVIDENPLCNIAFVRDNQPYCIPTICWREKNHIYWHGSKISTLIQECENNPVCLTICKITGLVLAKSAFNHSATYESALIIGIAKKVEGNKEKFYKHYKTLIELLYPNRWNELREITDKEMRATSILSLALNEASVKISEMGSNPKLDQSHPVWTGIIPISMMKTRKPIEDKSSIGNLPNYLKNYQFEVKR